MIMFEPILNRVKAGMSLEDCIVSIAGGNYELSIAILDACDLHIRVWSENNPNAIVMMLDMMRLYDDDLLIFCELRNRKSASKETHFKTSQVFICFLRSLIC
ncbi:MAG: hypothetical protein MNSN_10330 [Minisyncoccus archaeiphilus]|nr:MAG: hypothetical protein MNSN_10330 [Candidatus Parcubacteria bacterium]